MTTSWHIVIGVGVGGEPFVQFLGNSWFDRGALLYWCFLFSQLSLEKKIVHQLIWREMNWRDFEGEEIASLWYAGQPFSVFLKDFANSPLPPSHPPKTPKKKKRNKIHTKNSTQTKKKRCDIRNRLIDQNYSNFGEYFRLQLVPLIYQLYVKISHLI